MIDPMTASYAVLLLRWSLGILFIAPALLKIRVLAIADSELVMVDAP